MFAFPKIVLAATVLAVPTLLPAGQQTRVKPSEIAAPVLFYADYADLVVDAPMIVDATVRSELRLKPIDTPGLPANIARLYIEADVTALIRGAGAVPPRIGYTLDVPLGPNGRPPRYRKARVLLFARAVSGNPTLVQLVRPDGQRSWTPDGDALTRRIVREVLAPDAAPTITGIGNAFHTPGDLPGEGETQIFLTTTEHRPISFNITRKTGAEPHWAIALSEVVDQAAPPPARDTLLWYRLACTLPAALPDSAVTQSGDDATIAREDYALVVHSLGACDRGRRS